MMTNDEKWMKLALKEAKKAEQEDEVPIGCVIVKDGKVIARGHNKKESSCHTCYHAEIIAINKANQKLRNWRLEDCELYVTIEPCIMCSGAIIQSRIKRVIFGGDDFKGGGLGGSIDVLKATNINHYPEVMKGVLKQECSFLVSNYFKNKRNIKK